MKTEFLDEFIKLQHMEHKWLILGKRISTLLFLVPSNFCVEWSHTDNICAFKNTMMTKFAKEVTWSISEQWVELFASHVRIQQMKQKESSWEMAGHGRSTSWQLVLLRRSHWLGFHRCRNVDSALCKANWWFQSCHLQEEYDNQFRNEWCSFPLSISKPHADLFWLFQMCGL